VFSDVSRLNELTKLIVSYAESSKYQEPPQQKQQQHTALLQPAQAAVETTAAPPTAPPLSTLPSLLALLLAMTGAMALLCYAFSLRQPCADVRRKLGRIMMGPSAEGGEESESEAGGQEAATRAVPPYDQIGMAVHAYHYGSTARPSVA
jgi:hypothetical protein